MAMAMAGVAGALGGGGGGVGWIFGAVRARRFWPGAGGVAAMAKAWPFVFLKSAFSEVSVLSMPKSVPTDDAPRRTSPPLGAMISSFVMFCMGRERCEETDAAGRQSLD